MALDGRTISGSARRIHRPSTSVSFALRLRDVGLWCAARGCTQSHQGSRTDRQEVEVRTDECHFPDLPDRFSSGPALE